MTSNFPNEDDSTPPIYVCGVSRRYGTRCTSPQCQHIQRHEMTNNRVEIDCTMCGESYPLGREFHSEKHAEELAKKEAKEKKREERKKLKGKAGQSSKTTSETTTGEEN
ncbi:hypothetical protein LINGRAPRIM_LOCUS3212 [Linum grandiflorum]